MAHKWANNEGTLYYREDRGKWCTQVSLDGRRLTKYAKSQRECQEWVKPNFFCAFLGSPLLPQLYRRGFEQPRMV